MWRLSVVVVVVVIIAVMIATTQSSCPEKCKCALLIVDCSHNQWQILPAGLDVETVQLDLAHNDFTSVPSNISAFAPRLERLVLRRNRISALGKGALRGLTRLRDLDLSSNCFTTASDLHAHLLIAASALTHLDLSHNALGRFPKLASSSLEMFRCSNCSLGAMGDIELDALRSMRELHLGENPFRILSLPTSRTLSTLNLSWCDFQSVRVPSMQALPALDRLLLSHNEQLKSFEGESSSLTFLDISDCNLDAVATCRMPRVRHLDLSGNHIRRIDGDAFAYLPHVERILLSRNAITDVAETAFANASHLRHLDASLNPIRQLSIQIFVHNKLLESVSLARTYLSQMVAFRSSSLTTLDVSECEIVRIDRDCLLGMSTLRSLNLAGNQFTTLPINWCSQSLRDLDISRGRLTVLRNTSTVRLPNLHRLDISGNRLVELHVKHFHGVRQVRLADNPWRCQCDRKSFEAMYTYLAHIDSDVAIARCQTPEVLEGLTWADACRAFWLQTELTRDEKVWLVAVCLLVILFVITCAYITVRRERRKRVERRRQQEAAAVVERERLLQLIHHAATAAEETSNAPDPRDLQRPPSYTEAIALPPLGSSRSLASRKYAEADNHHFYAKRTHRKNRTQSNPDLAGNAYPKSPRRRRRRAGGRARSCERVQDSSDEEGRDALTETDV